MFVRLFRGFPNDAFDLQITNVHPANDNPQLLELTANISPNKEWIQQFRAGVEALGEKKLEFESRGSSCISDIYGAVTKVPWAAEIYNQLFSNSGTPICVRDDNRNTLYLLPIGNYKAELDHIAPEYMSEGSFPYLSVIVGFSNKPQSYKSQCFLSQPKNSRVNYASLHLDANKWYAFDAQTEALVIKVPITKIDLSLSEQITASFVFPSVNFAVDSAHNISGFKFRTDAFDEQRDLKEICENYVYRRALHQ